jgi:hypothetical protein
LDPQRAVPEILRSLRWIVSTSSNRPPPPSTNGDQISPDSLPRVFDGVVELIPTLIRDEYLTARQALAIRAVQRALGDLARQDDDGLWTGAALQNRADWQPVRQVARLALDEMNALTPNRPRLYCPD